MKFQDTARFEFRSFATNLKPLKRKLDAQATGEEQLPSRETYIVTRLNIESNVKIRGKRLQVKVLKARLRMLEQWEPILSAGFPVASADVESLVFPPLGLEVDLGPEAELTEDALLALVAGEPALATIAVDKRRSLYDLGSCEVEFCELEIEEERLHTVAIEAIEAEAAEQVVRELGLETADNESYPSFLQRRLF